MSDVSDAKQAELLMDHHKDTFGQILYHWKARNRLFLLILVLLAGTCVDLYDPGFFSEVANAYLHNAMAPASGDDASGAPPCPSVAYEVVSSIAWFLLLCLVINYYQRSIHVNRLYKYISRVEDDLDGLLGRRLVYREGRAYLSKTGVIEADPPDAAAPAAAAAGQAPDDDRPRFLKSVGWIYTCVFPAAMFLLAGCHLWLDWPAHWTGRDGGFYAVNALIAVVLVVYNVLYLSWVRWESK